MTRKKNTWVSPTTRAAASLSMRCLPCLCTILGQRRGMTPRWSASKRPSDTPRPYPCILRTTYWLAIALYRWVPRKTKKTTPRNPPLAFVLSFIWPSASVYDDWPAAAMVELKMGCARIRPIYTRRVLRSARMTENFSCKLKCTEQQIEAWKCKLKSNNILKLKMKNWNNRNLIEKKNRILMQLKLGIITNADLLWKAERLKRQILRYKQNAKKNYSAEYVY